MQIKTASDLKYAVENAGHEQYFFDRKFMKFFGDTMRNYGVRRTTVRSNYDNEGNWCAVGVMVEVYELYRRKPVKMGVQSSAYFDAVTFKRVYTSE